MEDLRSENSQEILKRFFENEVIETESGLIKFFLDHTDELSIKSRGFSVQIANKLNDNSKNPFGSISERTVRRWLSGETTINREYAYQICIVFNLGLEHSETFFKDYLETEFVRFNDWRDILYYYCIEKKYDLITTYDLYQWCINEVETVKENIEEKETSVTILTSVIKEAYNKDLLKTDELFISYMKEQKKNFHQIRNTRRRTLVEIIKILGKDDVSKGKKYIADFLANAFFDGKEVYADEDKDFYDKEYINNDEYFRYALEAIVCRRQNFSREFFILCLLIKGINSWKEIDDMLTTEYIDYPPLGINNLFDACVLEACEYCKRTKSFGNELTAYERFCANTQILKYSRPLTFASDSITGNQSIVK